MTKDVLVSISGLQLQDVAEDIDEDAIEIITAANYFLKNGKHYVLYDELVEGMPGVIKNKIKINDDQTIEIIKTGITNSHMIFDREKNCQTYYQTPMGQMLVGVNTKQLDIDITEEKIRIRIDYELDINHEPLANCKIRMSIASRGSADFDLRSTI
ncbi:MAG: DUF1934 domain-containing protein [Hespellia sp.]|nr:DUF1934 domain-containing protein [Hespellia sp.]